MAARVQDESEMISTLEQARAELASCSARIEAVLDQLGSSGNDTSHSRSLPQNLVKPTAPLSPPTGTGTGSTGTQPSAGVVLRPLDLLLADLGTLRSSANEVTITALAIELMLKQGITDCKGVASLLSLITKLSTVASNTRRMLDIVALYPPATLVVLRVRKIVARLEKLFGRVAPPLRKIEGTLATVADKLEDVEAKVAPLRATAAAARDELSDSRNRYLELGDKYAWVLPNSIETCVTSLHRVLFPLSSSIERSSVYRELPTLRALSTEVTTALDPVHQLQPLLTSISSLLDAVLSPLYAMAQLLEPLGGLADLLGTTISVIADLLDSFLNMISLGLFDQIEAMLTRIEQDIETKLDALAATLTEALTAPFQPWLAKLTEFEQMLRELWAPIDQTLDTYHCYTGG